MGRVGLYLLLLLILSSCKKEFPNVQTEVLGHAGESIHPSKSKFPPNSMKSIEEAFVLGADGVEVDVQLTADKQLVVYHDENLSTNSDGSGCINSLSYDDISDVNIYNTNEKIPLLSDVLSLTISAGRKLFLDVKPHNFCSNSAISANDFNNALNQLLLSYTDNQKELLTVNCTSVSLLAALSDTCFTKSLESDNPETAIQNAQQYNFDMLTLKLSVLNTAVVESIVSNGIALTIFNVKTRKDINQALEFNPSFVISDNISCTLKSING